MKQQPSMSQVVIPLFITGLTFGLWQHNYFAGIFIVAILVFWTNHQ